MAARSAAVLDGEAAQRRRPTCKVMAVV
jgi:hypothetical protein